MLQDYVQVGDEGSEKSNHHFIEEQNYETKNSATQLKLRDLKTDRPGFDFRLIFLINYIIYLKFLSLDFYFEEQQQNLPYMDEVRIRTRYAPAI